MRKFLLAPFIWIARFFSPSDAGWYGATRALWILWILMVVSLFATDVIPKFSVSRAIGFGVFVATYTVVGAGVALAIWLISLLKPTYRLALLAGFFPVFFSGLILFGMPGGVFFALAVFLFVSLIFGSLNALFKNESSSLGRLSTCVFLGLGVLILAGLGYLLIKPAEPLNKFLDEYELADWTLDAANPGERGSFQVTAFNYGSGTDQNRPEYGIDADWISQSVDGSKLIDHWDGPTGWNRTKYWGFDSTSLPIQGRVWMPEGDGPFPLVLIVHGNHSMEEHSDNGFQYLGEHLASRGFILVSVDETFLNGSTANKIDPRYWGLGEENDARGWMLLEHLDQWQNWHSESGHPMAGKIDMDRIALIGHSRGGEAVAVAAVFNDLDFYPDDATVKFDYKFNIRACIAIAPADGQYKPREERTKLKDINYFTIQGAMDGDVSSFGGSSQYSRISLTPGSDYVKASLYLAGANHGQFNTSRSIYDTDDLLFGWLLNTEDIMPATDQRQIARVYFTAFLEAMLNNQKSYLPLFSDARYGANWLPKTYYVNNMQLGSTTYFANFDEDLNPGSGSTAGAKIEGHNLSKWRESLLNLKWNPLDSIVAVLAWDDEVQKATAEYHIQWDDGAIETDADSKLVFSACVLDESTKPKNWTESDQDKIETDAEATKSSEDKAQSNGDAVEEEERTPLDWTIVVTDTEGRESRLKLSADQPLYPQLQSQTSRLPLLSTNPTSEIVMRRFTLPLSKFVETNSTFDPLSIVSMKFVFDQTKKGIIAVDDFGIE